MLFYQNLYSMGTFYRGFSEKQISFSTYVRFEIVHYSHNPKNWNNEKGWNSLYLSFFATADNLVLLFNNVRSNTSKFTGKGELCSEKMQCTGCVDCLFLFVNGHFSPTVSYLFST